MVWRNEHAPIASATQTVQSLSDEQHELLLDLGYADKLALQLRNTCGALLDHLADDELYVLVDSQLERAREYRISGDENLSSYVTTGFSYRLNSTRIRWLVNGCSLSLAVK